MDRLFRYKSDPPIYEPVPENYEEQEDPSRQESRTSQDPFSWIEYLIFMLLGVSMLWAWNMFLAAGPYFQKRFHSEAWILDHFQSAILSVSTIANLGSMVVLTKLQTAASYPKRIIWALVLNLIVFTLLALSTSLFRDVKAWTYLTFVLSMVFVASLATGLSQNGVFAFVSGFGREEYMQAIMTGQAVAGVLPCIAQIISVLSVPESSPSSTKPTTPQSESSLSAFAYFLTATGISTLTLVAFLYLLPRHQRHLNTKRILRDSSTEEDADSRLVEKRSVSFMTFFSKLRWLSAALFLCFAVTMLFPVFTQAIISVKPAASSPRIFHPSSFIPLAFLFWNTGDLLGRLSTLLPFPPLLVRPKTLTLISVLRLIFIPLYYLCNLRSRASPPIKSDAFYLIVVQLGFGLTNGWLGSMCMMHAPEYVEEEEREAAGGFMGLMLVGGLTFGSLASFAVAV